MNQLFLFSSSMRRDPAVDDWMKEHPGELGAIARHWFDVMRDRGDDVRELLHDGHPTACVAEAAFAYVNAFTAHVNVGFLLENTVALITSEAMGESTATRRIASPTDSGWTSATKNSWGYRISCRSRRLERHEAP